MDEKEKDELLYRVDERTARLEDELIRRLEDLEDTAVENRGRINTLEKNTTQNSRDLRNAKAVIGALAGIVATVATKVFGFLGI